MRQCAEKTGFVDRDGVRLFFRIRGQERRDRPTLVFVHGDDSNITAWRCQQDSLCRGFQTIAIDMRGFGRSSKPPGPLTIEVHREDLRFLLQRLKVRHFVLIGWSIGGLVVQSYVIAYPGEAEKLVLVDTVPQILRDEKFPWGRSAEEQAAILAVIATDFPRYAREGSQAAVPETCPGAAVIRKEIEAMILQTGKDIAFRQTADAVSFSSVDALSSIAIPTLIVVGAKDTVLNPNASFFMRERIPQSHLIEFPSAGHAPFLTFKDDFNRDLKEFLMTGLEQSCQICPPVQKARCEDSVRTRVRRRICRPLCTRCHGHPFFVYRRDGGS